MAATSKFTKYDLLGFPISTGKYDDLVTEIVSLGRLNTHAVVCVANVHMFIEAYKSPSFLKIIRQADLITADGRPLVWALKLIHNINQDRVAGMDLLPDLLTEMASQNISAFFYGGTPEMSDMTRRYLANNYPKLKVGGFYNPPFGAVIKMDDEVVKKINGAGPCVVFVALGCPKQEIFMHSVKDKINSVMIGIGGALPVMLGMQKRSPKWMQDKGLEWLFRLSQEPKRLFRRYLKTNSLFLWIFFKLYIKQKIFMPLRAHTKK